MEINSNWRWSPRQDIFGYITNIKSFAISAARAAQPLTFDLRLLTSLARRNH
jgi:hypothetical protein